MSERKLTTWEVLRYKFPENEYVLIQEVSDASGFSRSRSIDFMIINLWQSRGLAITGIERKSNRNDWLREIKQPQKQENHFKYCDYFYLLTDKEGVAKIEEIPDSWGWYHINESGVLKTLKQAPKLSPVDVNRSFLCAMLRRAADKTKYVHVDSLESRIQESAEKIKQQRNSELERKAGYYDDLKARVDEFEKASGLSLAYRWDSNATKMGEAVKLVMNGGIEQYKEGLERIEKQIKNIHEGVANKLKALSSCSIVAKPLNGASQELFNQGDAA